MSSPLTPEIYAAAARSIGWPSIARISPSDIPFLIATHRLDTNWTEGYVMVAQAGKFGHIERVGADPNDALFNAVVMCAALVGGVRDKPDITILTEHPPCATHAKGGN